MQPAMMTLISMTGAEKIQRYVKKKPTKNSEFLLIVIINSAGRGKKKS